MSSVDRDAVRAAKRSMIKWHEQECRARQDSSH
jgi:hypothetical protein